MNIKINVKFLVAILVISLSTSACGMKRALTMPPKEQLKEQVEQQSHKDIPSMQKDLSNFASIDVLRPKKIES